MEKKTYINEDGSINMSMFNQLSESEQIQEQATWSDQQWWQFFSQDAVMTHDEFCGELDKIIEEVYGKV